MSGRTMLRPSRCMARWREPTSSSRPPRYATGRGKQRYCWEASTISQTTCRQPSDSR
jgi:hypothetical protein